MYITHAPSKKNILDKKKLKTIKIEGILICKRK